MAWDETDGHCRTGRCRRSRSRWGHVLRVDDTSQRRQELYRGSRAPACRGPTGTDWQRPFVRRRRSEGVGQGD